jgi:hypothetical protein
MVSNHGTNRPNCMAVSMTCDAHAHHGMHSTLCGVHGSCMPFFWRADFEFSAVSDIVLMPQVSHIIILIQHIFHAYARMERTPPPPFVCPITMDVMDNAVIDLDGYSYDRAAIEDALRRNRASPMTRRPMAHTDLIPNRALRDAIAAWEREQPMAIDPDLLTLDDPRIVIGRGAFGEVRYSSLSVRHPL